VCITANAREQLIVSLREAHSVGEVFATASKRLRRLIPFDAAVWLATDPPTGLPTAPTRMENMGHVRIDACLRGWELEFTVADVNLYRDLARPVPPPASDWPRTICRSVVRATGISCGPTASRMSCVPSRRRQPVGDR